MLKEINVEMTGENNNSRHCKNILEINENHEFITFYLKHQTAPRHTRGAQKVFIQVFIFWFRGGVDPFR